MKIESYDPFHIGSKIIYYVNRRTLISKVYDFFELENQKKNEEIYDLNKDIIDRDVILSPLLNILTNKKTKTSIQMNLGAEALNVIGNDPINTFKLFNLLIEKLPTLGFELESTFLFYEVISNVVLLLEENPAEIFDSFSPDLFSNIQNLPKLSVNYIRFSDRFIEGENQERTQIQITPHRTSPNKRINLRILKRFNEIEGIESFINNFNDLIKEIYKRLETN